MGRTRKVDPDEFEEFDEDSGLLGEQSRPYLSLADQDGPPEVGDTDRRGGFARLNDEELFRYRDF